MKNTLKKAFSIVLVLATLISAASIFGVSASAANYSTDYSSYTAPGNNDFARWNGSKVVKGSKTTKNMIKWMQAALNYCVMYENLNASLISVDGSFGPASKNATIAFQKATGLTQDGSFGPDTIKKMKSVLSDGKVSFENVNAEYNLVWPVSTAKKSIGNISSGFGPRNIDVPGASKNHRGIDIVVATGTEVYSAADGKVTLVGYTKNRGNFVIVYHESLGISTIYQHLKSYSVKKGSTVSAGEKIAISGNTGVGGAHLHFGVMIGKATYADYDQPGANAAIDPMSSRISYRNYK